MIDIKVVVRGEIDTPTFVRFFRFPDREEESLFFDTVGFIKKKFGGGLKLNANETLAIFCAYVIEQIREHRSLDEIENTASRVISSDQVFIGVPETLREMSFEVIIDNSPKQQIKLVEPMQVSNYMMT
jgi:urease gamma subunit